MSYKRILTIQDISCAGQCSLTVALPILSACGMETCILPSAVLSTHTAPGFTGFTFRDLTDDIPAIQAHWQKIDLRFDAIYTGYLGSLQQIDYVKEIFRTLGKPGCERIVDPAMADNGALYSIFDDAYVAGMRTLCAEADIVLPNITEACFLTGMPYRTEYDRAYIDELLEKLSAICPKTIVLTGVSYQPGMTGVLVYQNGEQTYYEHPLLPRSCHGTGDIYASAFTGARMRDKNLTEAAKIAADYTFKCIENTQDDPDHWYGAKFETALGDLIDMLR